MHVSLVLPFASPSQNELMRWHWSRRSRLKNDCRMLIRAQLRSRGIAPTIRPDSLRRMAVLRLGPRTLDDDNLRGGFKPILDAIVSEFLLHDDSPKWLDGTYKQSTAPAPGETRIVIFEPV